MVDKTLFMETLRSVQEIAKASPEPMSREEIQEYFKDMELSSQQQEMIYQFFQKPLEDQSSQSPEGSLAGKAGQSPEESLAGEAGQSPEGSLPGKSMKGTSQYPGSGKNAVHSRHYQMYLNEIHNISDLSREGISELYQKLLEGDRLAISVISAQWLKKITTIAKAYVTGRALVEDLVQEGNMGLLLGMEQLLGAKKQRPELSLDSDAMEQQLETYVREAMEQYRLEMEGTDYGESALLAKVNLVYEARKVLAEENGTIPSIRELSDYTKIPAGEIRDIMALSRKKGEQP